MSADQILGDIVPVHADVKRYMYIMCHCKLNTNNSRFIANGMIQTKTSVLSIEYILSLHRFNLPVNINYHLFEQTENTNYKNVHLIIKMIIII